MKPNNLPRWCLHCGRALTWGDLARGWCRHCKAKVL